MPTDSHKDTRLSPIVALFRGVILSGFRVVFRDLNPTKSGKVRGWLAKAGSLGRVGVSVLWGRGSELAVRGSVGVRVSGRALSLPT